MIERVCKNCGGRQYRVVGQNMVKCEFCGTLYVDEHASKEEEVLIVGAYEILRAMRFEDAVVEFDEILALFPMSFEAYFGRMLAKNKIILYTNKKGTSRKPRFFGDSIPSVLEDADYKKAIEFAPPEVTKTYTEQARRIERYKKFYEEEACKQSYDVVMCAVGYQKNSPDSLITQAYNQLKEKYSVYFLQELEQREREANTFRALETCKAFLLYAGDNEGYLEYKNLFDRYSYHITQKKKTKSGFIIALDETKVKPMELPNVLSPYKNVFIVDKNTFLQDVALVVDEEIKKTTAEVAKIETVKLETVQPKKKEYVEFESVNPSEFGHYQVENVSLSDENKVKWIYLLLKNGDFNTAQDFIRTELEKDSYNAEVLFAEVMANKNIKTQEDFFAKIDNFKDKEELSKILSYASKDFAEYIVDNWEKLVVSLNEVEYYNLYLLFLAQYNTPNRDSFIRSAEEKAVETMDEDLIEKVLKCFDKNDVDRFVDFYYMLAQKSDGQKYYQKILELDEGHEQSNLTLLLSHFKTDEDKLTFRDRQEIEAVFKYFSEETRAKFVNAIIDIVMPIVFLDVEEAEKQLDFYLSYVTDEKSSVQILKKIGKAFQEKSFFRLAEKYITIAISKDKNNAELYWLLIKIKAHCKSDSEVISSSVKITQIPEWETLVSVATEKEQEKIAEIISRNNLYKGERRPFSPENIDRKQLITKLEDFLLRNEQILLELEKEHGASVASGVRYYKLQLEPFKVYIEKLKNCKDFKVYKDILEKTNQRLDALDLTLETSVNVVNLTAKGEGLKPVYNETKTKQERYEKTKKSIKNDKFLKRFLCMFLEFFPMLFTTLLLIVVLVMPKEVYLYFSQDFMLGTLLFCVAVSVINLSFYLFRKKKLSTLTKVVCLVLFSIGLLNVGLFGWGFYFAPKAIEVSNNYELQVLTSNAKYAKLELASDLDFSGVNWTSKNFHGTLDGKNHRITNITLADGGFFAVNSGYICNLDFYFAEQTSATPYKNISLFGGIAKVNSGVIDNCQVYGSLAFDIECDSTIGGLVGRAEGGIVSNCKNNLVVTINAKTSNLTVGGFIGEQTSGRKTASITKNSAISNPWILYADVTNLQVGGLVGSLRSVATDRLSITQNALKINMSISGHAENGSVGGLVGEGRSASDNNYTQGKINATGFMSENGCLGGLYGRYINTALEEKISYSYSIMDIAGENLNIGGIVGGIGGSIGNCFSNIKVVGTELFKYGTEVDCFELISGNTYDERVRFSDKIWRLVTGEYPTLLWERG